MLLGAFTWDGETRSFGMIVNQAPKPASFTFDFKSNLHAGSTKIGFSDGTVTDIAQPAADGPTEPVPFPCASSTCKGVRRSAERHHDAVARRHAPIRATAAFPSSTARSASICCSAARARCKVTEQQPSGQPGIAHVCRVRYLPIAGHKIDSETKFMAANDAIEVALRPVPSANVFMPYQISIPTMAGSATIVSKRVEIVSPGKPQIAMLY